MTLQPDVFFDNEDNAELQVEPARLLFECIKKCDYSSFEPGSDPRWEQALANRSPAIRQMIALLISFTGDERSLAPLGRVISKEANPNCLRDLLHAVWIIEKRGKTPLSEPGFAQLRGELVRCWKTLGAGSDALAGRALAIGCPELRDEISRSLAERLYSDSNPSVLLRLQYIEAIAETCLHHDVLGSALNDEDIIVRSCAAMWTIRLGGDNSTMVKMLEHAWTLRSTLSDREQNKLKSILFDAGLPRR